MGNYSSDGKVYSSVYAYAKVDYDYAAYAYTNEYAAYASEYASVDYAKYAKYAKYSNDYGARTERDESMMMLFYGALMLTTMAGSVMTKSAVSKKRVVSQ